MALKQSMSQGVAWVRCNPGKAVIVVILALTFLGLFGRAF